MRSVQSLGERPLFWVGSAKKDLMVMPPPVVRFMGMALGVAQRGGTHPSSKPWRGLGPGVVEVAKDFDGGTFRAVYTVNFRRAVYVLHCFQKKSPSGIRTSRSDVDLVTRRLKAARNDYEVRHGKADE